MKKIWVTISSTALFFLLVTGPAWATHLYPPGRGHGGAGGGGGGGDDGPGDGFDPGAGGGLGDGDGFADAGTGGAGGADGAGGAGDGLADTGGRFTVGMLLLIVSLLVLGTILVMASRRRKTEVVDY